METRRQISGGTAPAVKPSNEAEIRRSVRRAFYSRPWFVAGSCTAVVYLVLTVVVMPLGEKWPDWIKMIHMLIMMPGALFGWMFLESDYLAATVTGFVTGAFLAWLIPAWRNAAKVKARR